VPLPNLGNLYRHPKLGEPFTPKPKNVNSPWTGKPPVKLPFAEPPPIRQPLPLPRPVPAPIPNPLSGIKPPSPLGVGLGAAAGIILELLFPLPTGDPEYKEPTKKSGRKPDTTPPSSTPISGGIIPFNGGQSVGVSYVVTAHDINPANGVIAVQTITGIGKMGGVETVGLKGKTIRFGLGREPTPSYTLGGFSDETISARTDHSFVIVNVRRSDNQPDTGGNPPAIGVTPSRIGNFIPSPEPYGIPKDTGNGEGIKKPSPIPQPGKQLKPIIPPLGDPIPSPAPSPALSPAPSPTDKPSPTGKPSSSPNSGGSAIPTPSPSPVQSAPITIIQNSPVTTTEPKKVGFPIISPIVTPITTPVTVPIANLDPQNVITVTFIPVPSSNLTPYLKPELEIIYLQNVESQKILNGIPDKTTKMLTGDPTFNQKQLANNRDAICLESQPEACIDGAIKRNNLLIRNTCLQQYEIANCKIFKECDPESKPVFEMKSITVQLGDKILIQEIFEKIYNIESKQCDISEEFYAIPINTYHQNVVFQPQISLVFYETLADAKALDRQRTRMYLNIRVVGKRSETITAADITNYTNAIEAQFPNAYLFNKGKLSHFYYDFSEGHRIRLYSESIQMTKQLLTKIFAIQGLTPDFDKLTENKFTDKDLSTTETKTILGNPVTLPEKRTIAKVGLVRAELKIHGISPDILLIDRSRS
jgi:hypothetical protein